MNIQEQINQMDIVTYKLHFTQNKNKKEKLEKLKKESTLIINDYIWQEEPFQLELHTSENYFEGKTKYRDNIDDEWFIVFVLLELSKLNEDIACQIEDSDGQFLLIESEQHIPEWINPENSQNRVFIHKGRIHIIPISPSDPSEIDQFTNTQTNLSISSAISILNSNVKTEASKEIQMSILKRIPEKDHHHVRCFIPKKVAQFLQFNPQLVSKAVNSFFYRTPDTMKCLSNFKLFKDDYIMHRVTFTRCLFAQLKNPPFQLPRSMNNLPPKYHKDYLAYFLGYRLTCGFEMHFNENLTLLKEMETNINKISFQESKTFPPDDSEEWLNIYNEASEKITNKEKLGDDIVNKMKQFFSSESSIDGIEFEKDSKLKNMLNMDDEEITPEMKEYMNAMDQELKEYGLIDNENDDIDLNLLQNMLEGFKSESGDAGPISNLFKQMGLDLPDDLDESPY
jgi:hypothetical protein